MRSVTISTGFEGKLIDCLLCFMRCEKSSHEVLKDL